MTLMGLLVALLVVALILYVVQLLPLDPPVRLIIQVLVAIILIFWLLGGAGFDYKLR